MDTAYGYDFTLTRVLYVLFSREKNIFFFFGPATLKPSSLPVVTVEQPFYKNYWHLLEEDSGIALNTILVVVMIEFVMYTFNAILNSP
ncbi:hypothetical protein BpHYR1_014750 [Brachionus plicatilis]|uniref:Uncharacterized protein n=1 Tax=Brachionus plicatilis TaxID=10195 RepID=A0A3M7S3L2_BRAPC|nr:hypothetical protein BpHYR1_014750 [Brachionus plicatilis]